MFGPQTGYFNPQILMEIDLHGPGIDARGAAFDGVNLYVTLGRGPRLRVERHLREPGHHRHLRGRPLRAGRLGAHQDSTHYLFRGKCMPMEVLERRNTWTPSAGDTTPAGHADPARLPHEDRPRDRARRRSRASRWPTRSCARPTCTRLDAAHRRLALQQPQRDQRARATSSAPPPRLHYTFHWFYADSRDIAYINTGDNPVRARGVNQNLPTRARSSSGAASTPTRYRARYVPFAKLPR